MSDPNAARGVEDGGIIGPDDRPELEVGGAGAGPDPGGSPESYREALRDLMGSLVAQLAPGEESADLQVALEKPDPQKPVKDASENPSLGEGMAPDKGIRDVKRAKDRSEGGDRDPVTPSAGQGQERVIDDMIAALQEIRGRR